MNSKNFLSSFLFSSSLFSVFSISCDSPEAWQMLFQDPATSLMEGIINLHHDLMFRVEKDPQLECYHHIAAEGGCGQLHAMCRGV